MRNFFPKELRLRSNPEFQRVLTRGKKLVGKLILVDYAPRKIPQTRLGVTVSRKYGKSHLRKHNKPRIINEWKKEKGKVA